MAPLNFVSKLQTRSPRALTIPRIFPSRPMSLDQTQLSYLSEQCIQVDYDDNIIGHVDKKSSHLAVNIRKGILHRAFSVFLFNTKGELLLQQRASEKITFPDCWTNTCCSHPLHVPEEIDSVQGAKFAARRKLKHELGIDESLIDLNELTYLTRIYYGAIQDDGVWGEHESRVDESMFDC
eukprot:TRINITY_DN3418_c0_g1_i2.p1 TRINITY_DN3418_c0_g1~~TRINITY_DN3418_c0_g1_i2.p1  ORF type:complete len:180 (-),score=21.87 TRINITY_DN3418_c0_g1_i2:375-914(-)